ncbi:MAG: hypothetical protein PVH88_20565 [Ignavibacteria bacterium]|jgi:hypothetical protein
MNKTMIYVGETALKKEHKTINGEIIKIDNESYYKIYNYDEMPPFLMSIVSDSDLWMFISSNGALTAGRRNPDSALFPYYTDDRIHDSHNITGSKTVVLVKKEEKVFLWEPFSNEYNGLYKTERSLYKNLTGNKVIFVETNHDLSVTFKYAWMNCDKFGFVKKSSVTNNNSVPVHINILDGIQNILPYGVDRKFQLEYSTLLDGYKKNELIEDINLGLFTLSSIPTDRAEPNEALRATTVWSAGFDNPLVLLSSKQVGLFKQGKPLTREVNSKAERGAYFLQHEFDLKEEGSKQWYIIADLNKDHSEVAALSKFVYAEDNLQQQIENEIFNDTGSLKIKVAGADGFQLSNDPLITARHCSNVIFNIMRGGVFDNNYRVSKNDFVEFIQKTNIKIRRKYSNLLGELPGQINIDDLIKKIKDTGDNAFEKLCCEYLPLTFSRRHGDPSRPWNMFSIDIKDEQGNKVLNYQGNWRDIFQNWEALAISFPCYIENMIVKFVNASTADGYNPYRVTRDGFDWEVLDPTDPWSYIGYWGDHQIIYLLKLLELSAKFHPGVIQTLLTKEIFAYAKVPYKIKSYQEILNDPHNTIDFDSELDAKIREKVKEIGGDGKFIINENNEVYQVNLTEKLLVSALTKLSNFIPEAGIWMNTQRPEWNDANNALVGYGASMVTLYYLRRYVTFFIKLLKEVESGQIKISTEVLELFSTINRAMTEFRNLLNEKISNGNRKKILDKLGLKGSNYRLKIYSKGFSGIKESLPVSELVTFLKLSLEYIDHSIKANKRDDDLYHSYNLIKINNDNEICISNLYEMLEGQVAILSSSYLSFEDSIKLLGSMRKSKLYRKDQNSYLLYPERQLARFTEKNIIPDELLELSQVLQNEAGKSIVVNDVNGNVHFNSKFRNASYLKQALKELKKDSQEDKEKELILNIYESVFDHQSFTGRSGTFYKYEGLGSIYWHMVSKLLLSLQETFYRAADGGADVSILEELKKYYYEIRLGIGCHKSPELYGAFPIDPYSHTPANAGAQQPGMTGQVKEDIISRFGELGLQIIEGQINFNPILLDEKEFLIKSQVYRYYDVNGKYQTLMLNPGMLAFTFCQVPVVYIKSDEQKVIITKEDGVEEEIDGLLLDKTMSKMIFERVGRMTKIKVLIKS